MRELHLFAGVGGGILGGMLLGHVPVCAVEIDPYCRKVLKVRQLEGLLPSFPIAEDVRTFDAQAWRGKVDVVCGGFPCQPWSSAGKRLGAADPRHLWPEMARIISECRPSFVFAENVSLAAFAEPWRDLRGLGYRVPPAICLAAADLGAPHLRKRWWLLAADADRDQHQGSAYAERWEATANVSADAERQPLRDAASKDLEPSISVGPMSWRDGGDGDVAVSPSGRLERGGNGDELHCAQSRERDGESSRGGGGVDALADTSGARFQGRRPPIGVSATHAWPSGAGWWATEPRVGRVANGVPARVDRLRALGNAQVPAVAAAAFRHLMETNFAGVKP